MKRVSLLLAVVLLLSVLPLGASAAGTQLAFTQQPQDCTVTAGLDTAVFSVQAVGDPAPTYQWQLKKTDTWENLYSATSPTYTITRTYPDMDGWQYRCLATSGEKTIASRTATLHARAIPILPVSLREIPLPAPVAGEVPVETFPNNGQYSLEAPYPKVYWSPDLYEGTFAPDTVYTATFYLVENSGYTLDGLPEDFFRIPGASRVTYDNTPLHKVTAVFPKTGGDPLHYPVTCDFSEERGTVTLSDSNPAKGDTVIVTVTAAPHYVFSSFSDGIPSYKDLGGGRFSFVMPANAVNFSVHFDYSDPLPYPFEDDAPYYAYHAICYLYAAGIMDGTSDTTFSCEAPMTRAMMATVLYRMAGQPPVTDHDTPFSDVPSNTWYTQAVAWAADKGILKGTSPTTFSPGDQVTREQLATMLWRYDGSPAPSGDTALSFPDGNALSSWATQAMAWAVGEGIVEGYNGLLLPTAPAIRGQVAAMLWRYLGSPMWL